jgi:ribonucleotide reductase beta subunit family protein with ferritin-like domain
LGTTISSTASVSVLPRNIFLLATTRTKRKESKSNHAIPSLFSNELLIPISPSLSRAPDLTFSNDLIFHNLTFSNELIFHDEGLHCDFACILCDLLHDKLDESYVRKIITDTIEIEHKFITGEDPLGLPSLSNTSQRVPTSHAPNTNRCPPHNR